MYHFSRRIPCDPFLAAKRKEYDPQRFGGGFMLEYLRKKQTETQAQGAGPEHTALSAGMGNQAMLSMLESQEARQSARPASGGEPLADAMRVKFEQRFGVPMDDVQVYRNSPKPAQLGSLAYAKGTDVFIGPGQEQHLEHELGHVVQQKFGLVKPTTTIDGLPVNLDQGLEQRADMLSIHGHQAIQGNCVVQMKLPYMYHQIGLNCGFSALSRAISKLIPNEGNTLDARHDLEKRLTTHAVQNDYSIMGEAFDPEALVRTCNDLYGEKLLAETVSIDGENSLQMILESAKGKDQVVLFPYFTAIDASTPKENKEGRQNAHWAALDPNDLTTRGTILLYEGNKQGVVRKAGAVSPKGWATKDLQTSNESITGSYDWEPFINHPRIPDLQKKEYLDLFLHPSQKDYRQDLFSRWGMNVYMKFALLNKKEVLQKNGGPNSEQLKESVNLKGKAVVISLKSLEKNPLDDEVD